MANYNGMILTAKGRDLQTKSEAGTKLVFTRVKVGDGLCRIRTHITNIGLETGVFVYETGLYAQGPDVGEILYGVTTATTKKMLHVNKCGRCFTGCTIN